MIMKSGCMPRKSGSAKVTCGKKKAGIPVQRLLMVAPDLRLLLLKEERKIMRFNVFRFDIVVRILK